MESLRSRAPAPRKGIKPVARLNKPKKNVLKSRVDDKIKGRMSARYATISAPTPADDASAPSVPTVPLGLRPSLGVVREQDEAVQRRPLSKEDLRAAESKLLDADEFDPDACAWSQVVTSSHKSSGLS